ncbi:hypothetical protein MACH09_31490 [Vibrio sp. MACH09]|nr:hypothetical protein MACH09_31490 [Vibrio sp. MACH09]
MKAILFLIPSRWDNLNGDERAVMSEVKEIKSIKEIEVISRGLTNFSNDVSGKYNYFSYRK